MIPPLGVLAKWAKADGGRGAEGGFREVCVRSVHQSADPEPVNFLDVMRPEEFAVMEPQYELADKPPDS